MLKVLHFGRFYSEQFGGIERNVADLLAGLSKVIHVDNLVAHERFRTEIVQQPNYKIYKVASLGVVASTALCPTMPYWVRRLYRQHHYDIAHLHFPDPMAHLASYFLPKSVKRVITWHSDIVRQQRLLKIYQPFLQHIIKQADAIIAPTPKHFSSSVLLNTAANAHKLTVIPFGVDTQRYSNYHDQEKIAAIRTQYPGKLIFALGRHVDYKGFEYLIKAMPMLNEATLLLGGQGPLTESLKTLVQELNLQHKVLFLGRINDDILPAYYHATDIFCLPSITPNEAFGLVQVEAMACQKPVVCCELNNGVTFVNQHGQTGLVVPPADSQALAKALNQLLANPELCQQFGRNGQARVQQFFDPAMMISETLKLYESLANR